jgi:hypothetical protein
MRLPATDNVSLIRQYNDKYTIDSAGIYMTARVPFAAQDIYEVVNQEIDN